MMKKVKNSFKIHSCELMKIQLHSNNTFVRTSIFWIET